MKISLRLSLLELLKDDDHPLSLHDQPCPNVGVLQGKLQELYNVTNTAALATSASTCSQICKQHPNFEIKLRCVEWIGRRADTLS